MHSTFEKAVRLSVGYEIEKAAQVMDDAIDCFLKQVTAVCENGPFRIARKLPTTFSMLRPANDEYYEYAYFERLLEWYTRDLLINSIMKELFRFHGVDTLWPDTQRHVNFSTESIENIYPFEFIIVYTNKRVGVRYTGLVEKEAELLASEYELHSIVRIKWDENTKDYKYENYKEMSPEAFFRQHLSSAEYELFIDKVKPAIETANAEIGFGTIPKLSLRYLSNFRTSVENELASINYKKMRFQVLPGSQDKFNLGDRALDDADHDILEGRYIKKRRFKALLGSEGFAKCFITAEYQYQVFKQGHQFDYTSVACGYLKAMEQLIYKLLQINLKHLPTETLWIKKNGCVIPKEDYTPGKTVRANPKTGKPQVAFMERLQPFFDTTLTPMVWFLHDNPYGWETSDASWLVTHEFLMNFANECRNDHLHKDNIDEFDVVSRIRNNALLIFYLLLGGYKLTGDLEEDKAVLGIIDDSFDRLYKKIQLLPRGISKFVIHFSGKEPVKAYRHYEQDQTIYDKHGSVASSSIRFIEVDSFNSEEYDNAMLGGRKRTELIITEKNMPERISYINGRNEEISIEW